MEEFNIDEILTGAMRSLSKRKPLFLSEDAFIVCLSEKLRELKIPMVDIPEPKMKIKNDKKITPNIFIRIGSETIGINTNFVTDNSRFIIEGKYFDIIKQGSCSDIFNNINNLKKMKLFHCIDIGFVIVLTNCINDLDVLINSDLKGYRLVWEDYSYIEVVKYSGYQNFRFRFSVFEV